MAGLNKGLVIDKDGVKRAIDFPFNVYGTEEELGALFNSLKAHLDNVGRIEGWIAVALPRSPMGSFAPISWEAGVDER